MDIPEIINVDKIAQLLSFNHKEHTKNTDIAL